jgi:endonuclease YncB( thermonuclease family)
MSAPVPNYAHKATFIEGHDGDSFWLAVDFGANTHGIKLVLPMYVRLVGIDTWEIPPAKESPVADPGFKKGYAARDFTNARLASGPITVQTIKPDGKTVGEEKYGRFLARVWVGADELPDLLRASGFEKR